MDKKASLTPAENKSGGDGKGNDNFAKRATVIRRKVDPNRLNNSGLSFQIAHVLHQKKLEKAQQQEKQQQIHQQQLHQQQMQQQQIHQQQIEQQQIRQKIQQVQEQQITQEQIQHLDENTTKTQREKKQMMSTSAAPVKTEIEDISSEQVDLKSSQKLSAFQSIPKVLSVPKITITSPPCENTTETLRENRCDRLEDVKRLLNRKILMRKLVNNTTDINTVPLSSRKQQPKTTVTLQLPPQTSIKSYRKSEVKVCTSTTSATSPVITVRKFHTLASQSHLKKETESTTSSTQMSQIPSNSLKDTSAGTTIRPVLVSSTEELKISNVVPQSTHLLPISTSRTNPIQAQTQVRHTEPQHTFSSSVLTTKAIIRPTTVCKADIPIQSQQVRKSICSPTTSQSPPQYINRQRKVFLTQSSTELSSGSSSTKKMALDPSNPRNKIVSTISTPKPKIFEIFSSKHSGQTELEGNTVKKPNILKANLDTMILTSPITKEIQSEHGTNIAAIVSKTAKSHNSNIIEGLENNATHKKSTNLSIRSEQKHSSLIEETGSTDSQLSQTQNVPIVLENKLLKPGEHIDLKGLRLACENYNDGQSKTTELLPTNQEEGFIQNASSDKFSLSDQTGVTKRKMHVIISNEKLKSAKADIAALAKKVLQRASISSPGSTQRQKVVSMAHATQSGNKSTVSSSEGVPYLRSNQMQYRETLTVQNTPIKQKPAILKASMSIVKKDLTQAARQKAALRKKVLAFCGIRDDEQVSPLREYPKTVEIFEEEEATDDDTSAPTAVDFIASLALQNCCNSIRDKVIEQENTDTNVEHQNVSNNEFNTNKEANIQQEIKSGKLQIEFDNEITNKKKSLPAEEKGNEITPNVQSIKLADNASLEIEGVTIDRSMNELNTGNIKKNQSDEISFKTLQNESVDHSPLDSDIITPHQSTHRLDEEINQRIETTPEILQKEIFDHTSLNSNTVILKQDNDALGDNKSQRASGENMVSNSSERDKITDIEKDVYKSDSSKFIESGSESINSIRDNKEDEALITSIIPTSADKAKGKDKQCILENSLIDGIRKSASEVSSLQSKVLLHDANQEKVEDKEKTENYNSLGSLENLSLKQTSQTSDVSKGTMRKRMRFRKAQINLTARKKPAMKTTQQPTSENEALVATNPQEAIAEDKVKEVVKISQSIPAVNDEEKLQTNSEPDKIEVYQSQENPETVESPLKAYKNTETAVNVVSQMAKDIQPNSEPDKIEVYQSQENPETVESPFKAYKNTETAVNVVSQMAKDIQPKESTPFTVSEVESAQRSLPGDSLESKKSISLSISEELERTSDNVSSASLESKKSTSLNILELENTKQNVPACSLDTFIEQVKRVPQKNHVPSETDKFDKKSENSKTNAIKKCNAPLITENEKLLLKTCETLKDHSSTPNYIISLNLESDKEQMETEHTESTIQKKLVQECNESGIKILASVSISDGSSVFPNVVKAKNSVPTPLPEVGTIIDMKAYGLEKSNADIIVQQVVLENLNTTKNKEVSQECSQNLELQSESQKPEIITMNSGASIQGALSLKAINCAEDNDSDILSCVADNNDNSDTDSNFLITSRKRLRRKRPISSILSTSGSEHETDEEAIPSSSQTCRISALKNFEGSSTSASSELFGFSAQTIGITENQNPNYEDRKADLVEHNLDLKSQKLTGKETQTILTSPFVAVDIRRNVPLKKRWELSQQHSHDETDITDDTSPAADDDTMDDEGNENKYLEQDESVNSLSSLETITVQLSATNRRDSSSLTNKKQKEAIVYEKKHEKEKSAEPGHQSPSSDKVLNTSKSDTTDPSFITKTEDVSPTKNASSCEPFFELMAKETSAISLKDEKTDVCSRKRSRKTKASLTESTTGESEGDLQHSDDPSQTLTPLTRKRGRPPKKVQRQDISTSNNVDIQITSSTPIEVIMEPSTSKTRDLSSSEQKKRGRKPRLETQATNLDRKISLKTNLVKDNRDERDLQDTEMSLLNIPNDEVDGLGTKHSGVLESDMSLKKKRGRKPRTSLETPLTGPTDESTPKESLNVSNELEKEVKKKRGRRPREQKLENLEENADINLPQEPQSVCCELETPLQKKRGRKPREIVKNSFADSPQVETSSPLPRKRGRKPRTMISNETIEAVAANSPLDTIINTTESSTQMKSTPRQVMKKRIGNTGDFNPRLLLIRRREQLDTEEVLTVPENKAGEGPLQCGLCLARTTQSNWASHLAEHYGVGWIIGTEPAIDVTTRSVVLSKMIAYFKQHGTPLLCRICLRSYRSSLGLLLHFESCGEVQSRIQCPICKNDYTKLSYLNHQRTCQLTTNDEDEKTSTTIDPMINTTGRFKRKSLMKAETKLKKLTKELSESDATFDPIDFIQYRVNSAEGEDGKGCYYCTVCPAISDMSFLDEAEAIKHVMEQHKMKNKSVKDFESDSSNFDEKSVRAEESEESEESEEMTGTDISAAESFDKKKATKSRSTKKASTRKKKNATEGKRIGSLPAVYSARSSDVPKLVLRKWKQFIGANYSERTLYTYAMPIYNEEKNRALEMLSLEIDSMKFTFSQSAKLFEVLGKPKALEWQNLQRFQSVNQPRSDKLICLSAPIKTLAWAPVPEDVADQYLVVSCRTDLFTFTRVKNPKREEALLFVYKITTSQEGSKANKDFSAVIHYALSVPNGPVHTLAFLPSGGYDQTINRLGLLAIGALSSEIKIYALPIEPTQCNELRIEAIAQPVRVVNLNPSFELILNTSGNDTLNGHSLITTQCLHICWSEFTGHQHIFASYVNGFIAFWDIKEPENPLYNLNCSIREGVRCFLPLNYFYFDEKAVKAFTIHYDTIGPRWLAAQGCARKLIIYDIHDMANPMPVKEELLKNIPRDMYWSPIWETFTTAFCDTIPNNGRTVVAFNPAAINFSHSKMAYMLCGVSTLHYNPWQNVYGIGVDNGDIVYINTRDMNHDLNVLIRSKNNTIALSILDIKRLDGGELIRPKSSDNSENWNMYEKDYKEKYGLVFGQVNKLTAANRNAYLNEKRIPPRNLERFMRISVLRWNLNILGKRYIAIGYENGFLRIMRFKRETYFN